MSVETDGSPDDLRRHLRRFWWLTWKRSPTYLAEPFILATTTWPSDESSCQLATFFRPVHAFTVVDKQHRQRVRFTVEQGRLQAQSLALQDNSSTD